MTEYHGGHRPPEDGAPLSNLVAGDTFPPDVYDHPEWYVHTGSMEPFERESIAAVLSARMLPETALVTVYRSVPDGATRISTGDWVALSRAYAARHGMDQTDPAKDWPVLSAKVPISTVRSGGNDLIEWGYWGPHVDGQLE